MKSIKNIAPKITLFVTIIVAVGGALSLLIDPQNKITLSTISFVVLVLVIACILYITNFLLKRVPSSLSILNKKSNAILDSIKGHLTKIMLKREYYKMLTLMIDLSDIDRTAPTIYSDKFDIISYKINDYLRIKYSNFLSLLDSKDDYVAISSLKFWAEGNAQSAQDFLNENYDAVLKRQVSIRRLIVVDARIFSDPAKYTLEVEYIRKIISIITKNDYYNNYFEKLNTFFYILEISDKRHDELFNDPPFTVFKRSEGGGKNVSSMSITTLYNSTKDCMHFNYDDNPSSAKKIEHYLVLFEELWKEKNNLESKTVIDIRELIHKAEQSFKSIKKLNIYSGKNLYYYTDLYFIAKSSVSSEKAIISIIEIDEYKKNKYTLIGDKTCYDEIVHKYGSGVFDSITEKWRLMRLELELQTNEYGIINDITKYFSDKRISIYFYSLYDNFYILMNCDHNTFINTISYFGSPDIGFTIIRHGEYQN